MPVGDAFYLGSLWKKKEPAPVHYRYDPADSSTELNELCRQIEQDKIRLTRIKENSMKKNCTTCGQTLPRVFPLGATVQNKYHHSLGVVLGPGVYKTAESPDLIERRTVNVILLSGINKGERRNWFITNTEVVHGNFHIHSREAL